MGSSKRKGGQGRKGSKEILNWGRPGKRQEKLASHDIYNRVHREWEKDEESIIVWGLTGQQKYNYFEWVFLQGIWLFFGDYYNFL